MTFLINLMNSKNLIIFQYKKISLENAITIYIYNPSEGHIGGTVLLQNTQQLHNHTLFLQQCNFQGE